MSVVDKSAKTAAEPVPQGAGRVRATAFRNWPVVLLVLLIVVFTFVADGFLSKDNWLATSVYAASLIPLAIGEMLVMLTAGVDLSIAGTSAVAGMGGILIINKLNWTSSSAWPVVVFALICVAIGAAIGLINGTLVARLRLAPFIVTLGMLEILTGAVNLLNHGNQASVTTPSIISFGSVDWGGWVSPIVAICAVLMVAFWLLLSRTRFGMQTYAIGSNPTAVRRLGVKTTRVITLNYVLSGALGGLAGFFTVSQFLQANNAVDTSSELTAIAAVVIGGTSLFGGSGTMLGTLVGVAILSVLLPGLVLSGLPDFWQTVATGFVIIAAICVEGMRAGTTPSPARRLLRLVRRDA
jgi:ribose transport system permease protein